MYHGYHLVKRIIVVSSFKTGGLLDNAAAARNILNSLIDDKSGIYQVIDHFNQNASKNNASIKLVLILA
jgi:hypothetical protein